jgi:hypothetical protein
MGESIPGIGKNQVLHVGNVLTNRGVLPPHTTNDNNSEIFNFFT